MNYHEKKCKDCAFFFAVFGPGKIEGGKPVLLGGQCRVSAPGMMAVLVPKPQQSIEAGGAVIMPVIERVTLVPQVAPDFWCGEFEQRAA